MAMDNGELEVSTHEMFLGSNVGDIPSSDSMNSFFDEIFNDTHACTHTHTCNPSGPDSSHTHTCYHVHTKERPSGNREAVRKYREKKKARTASLEDEVVRLRAMNQQLMKRVQSQVRLEAEVGRLKCLLVDIRGRIDGEIGSFPYQKHPVNQGHVNLNLAGGFLLNPCNMQQGVSMNHDLDVNGCDFEDLQCLGNHGSMHNEFSECGAEDDLGVVNPSAGTKRKVGTRAATSR